jgi:hypothetical protein
MNQIRVSVTSLNVVIRVPKQGLLEIPRCLTVYVGGRSYRAYLVSAGVNYVYYRMHIPPTEQDKLSALRVVAKCEEV